MKYPEKTGEAHDRSRIRVVFTKWVRCPETEKAVLSVVIAVHNRNAKMLLMNDAPLPEIKREEHRVPRWITALWLAFVVSLALTSIVMAIRSNGDLARTLGFLSASSILIFMLSVVAYLALYGLSILLEGVDYHKTHCDDSKHSAGMADFMR